MIFPWIWNVLPGPAWVRALVVVLILAATVFTLFEYVFPWVSLEFGIQDQNIENGQAP